MHILSFTKNINIKGANQQNNRTKNKKFAPVLISSLFSSHITHFTHSPTKIKFSNL